MQRTSQDVFEPVTNQPMMVPFEDVEVEIKEEPAEEGQFDELELIDTQAGFL